MVATPRATLPDVVALEQQLSELRERLEAQRRALDRHIDLTEVPIRLSTRPIDA